MMTKKEQQHVDSLTRELAQLREMLAKSEAPLLENAPADSGAAFTMHFVNGRYLYRRHTERRVHFNVDGTSIEVGIRIEGGECFLDVNGRDRIAVIPVAGNLIRVVGR